MIWVAFLTFAVAMPGTNLPTFGSGSLGSEAPLTVSFLICIGLSIPAAVLYAFGQIVGDIGASRDHLEENDSPNAAVSTLYPTQAIFYS